MSDGIMLAIGEDGVARQYDDTYDLTIHCESKEEFDQLREKLNRMGEIPWIPVTDGDDWIPPVDEDGYSNFILLSFANFHTLCIGLWIQDEDGGGAFYEADSDEPLTKIGLIVNAWTPARPYREE